MKYQDIRFPTKKRWLRNWWQRNINTFLYATENPEIKNAIRDYRRTWLTDETAKTPEELEKILKRIFLKDAEFGKDLTKLTWSGAHVEKEGEDYYLSPEKSKDGYIKVPPGSHQISNRWKIENPFHIFDDEILVPEWKMRLIRMMSDPNNEKNVWLFDPRFSIREENIIYPSSHIAISTLHKFGFLRTLDMHILGRLNLDYFVFWPMFFYYALTDDIDYVLKNASFLTYPIRAFLVDDGEHRNLVLRFYGDCNFNEMANFLKNNKKSFERLTKMLGNPAITGSNIKDFYMYKSKSDHGMSSLDALGELGRNKVIKHEIKAPKDMNYKDYVADAAIRRSGDLLGNKSHAKKSLAKPLKRIDVAYSQVKKEIDDLSKHDKYKNDKEVEGLIDKINQFRL